MMLKSLLVAMLALAAPRGPEREERDALMAEAAPLIIRESKGDPRVAAMLVMMAQFESGWRPRIMRSECKRHECDAVRTVRGIYWRARGTFQLHRNGLSPEAWSALLGPDSLEAQIVEAARRYRGALAMCRDEADPVLGAIRSASGKGCRHSIKTEAERMNVFRRVRAAL